MRLARAPHAVCLIGTRRRFAATWGKKTDARKLPPFLLASPAQQENDDDDDKQQPERTATNPNVVRKNWQRVHIDSCANERSINLPPVIQTIKGLSNPRA